MKFATHNDKPHPVHEKSRLSSSSINDSDEQNHVNHSKVEKLKNKKSNHNVSDNIKVDWDEKEVVSSEHGDALKYDATIHHKGKSATFEFTNSIHDYTMGNEPKDKDLLYAVLMDYSASHESREDFFDEFGYDPDSMKAHKIYDAVKGNASKLTHLFTMDEIEQLQKEFEDY